MITHSPKVTIDNAVGILHEAGLNGEDLPEAHHYGSRIVRAAQLLREEEKVAKRKASEMST